MAERLVATRLALGYENQSEFAKEAGIAKNTYNQWEHAKGPPHLHQLVRLWRRFGVPVEWVYFGVPTNLPHPIASEIPKELLRNRA